MKSIPPDDRIHLFMEVRHRTGHNGVPEDWTCNDRFLIHHGLNGGLFYAYQSKNQTDDSAKEILKELGCDDFIGSGHFPAGKKELRFEQPQDSFDCRELIRRLVADDIDVVRYYGNYHIVAPNNDECGTVSEYAK